MTKKIVRGDADAGNTFYVTIDGAVKYLATREVLPDARRGIWELMMLVQGIGWLIIARDKYSNDLMETIGIHENEHPVYGDRFRIPCTREEYEKFKTLWHDQFRNILGGSWSSEYGIYKDGEVLFERQE